MIAKPPDWPDGFLQTWEVFLSQPRTLDDLFASPLQFPLQRRKELDAMLEIARAISPKVVLEIGIDKGAGAWLWPHELLTVQRFAGIELRGTPYGELLKASFPAVDYHLRGGSSYDPATVAAVKSWLGTGRIDVLFLDGDKLNYLADFDSYLPLMASNGIVFLHDIREGQPRLDFQAITARGYRWRTIIDTSESKDATERERLGIPPAHAHEGWLRFWQSASCGVGVIFLEDRA